MTTKQMALIKNGTIQNIAVFNSTDVANERWRAGFCMMNDVDDLVEAEVGFGEGDLYQDGKFKLSQVSIERNKIISIQTGIDAENNQ